MSMAHGLESRVPFLTGTGGIFAHHSRQHQVQNGTMKYILRSAMSRYVPEQVMNRTDKMGFRRPFAVWAKGECRDFICDPLSTTKARQQRYVDNAKVISKINGEGAFSRSLWGFFVWNCGSKSFMTRPTRDRERLNTV